ncbi:MAG: trigger factor [Bacteroidales bacterium]
MNITKETTGELTALLKVEVKKADYDESVEKVLRDYKKKANVKGFRPGMVPIGLVRKMYGKAVMLDEINKLVSENIRKYLTDEKIDILGDPLPKSDEDTTIDLETQEDFSFSFELGLAPQFELSLTKKNKVDYYEIAVDDKMKNDYVSNYTRRFGQFTMAEVSEEKDLLKGSVAALDENGNVKAEGPSAEETTLSVNIVKDEEIKSLFIGKKQGDVIDFDLRKAFPNDYEIAGMLKMQKDEVKDINGSFRYTVAEISRFEPAPVDTELFNRIYGEGIVNTEEEFMTRIEEEITSNLKKESEYKLMLDIKSLCLEKTDFTLPEEFLKRWLLSVNENTTQEQLDKEFDSFRKDLKWQLIRNKVARDNELKVTEDELHTEAMNITRYQFQQYGLFYATDEQIHNYAHEMLKREDDVKRIADKIIEEKVVALVREMVKLENKSVSVEEFNKLFD